MAATHEDRNAQLSPGVAIKAPCRAASTGILTLSGEQTVDGVALVDGDRCLVKNQASSIANGIYNVSTGAWERSPDLDGNRDAVNGTIVLVTSGTSNILSLYELSCSTSPPVIDTTPLTFSLLSIVIGGAGSFSTIVAAGQITSTVATGTAPFVIASTTKVTNLNADLLDGTDWRAPGAIGGTTPAAGAFTTVTASGTITPSQTIGIVGTTTNNNAQTGSVGEYVQSIVLSGSAISLTTATLANITSISLTAGDWDVSGEVSFFGNAATNITQVIYGSSAVSLTLGAQGSFGVSVFGAAGLVPFAINSLEYPIPTFRYSLSVTTTIYLVVTSSFTVNTNTAYGLIRARRIR